MIPLRISLEGFLTYRERQSFDFSDAPLWMLHGANGVGKSAVFDAITFVLFDKHRGSEHGIDRRESSKTIYLINHNSDRLKVEFEFMIGTIVYRVERMIPRKGRATRLASCLNDGHWYPEPDTDGEPGFRNWVEQTIALNYEAFTSAVLLRQGQSEKLLDAKTDQRFEILTQLIDLNPYKQLFKQADAKRDTHEQDLKIITHQLAKIPSVSNDEIAVADANLTHIQSKLDDIITRIGQANRLLVEAQNWEKWIDDLRRKEQDLSELEQVLKNREIIELNHNRFRELEVVLPILTTIVRNRERLSNNLELTQRDLEAVLKSFRNDESETGFRLLYEQFIALTLENYALFVDTIEHLQSWTANEQTQTAAELSVIRTASNAIHPLQDLINSRSELQTEVKGYSDTQSGLDYWTNEVEQLKKNQEGLDESVKVSDEELKARSEKLTGARTLLGEVENRRIRFETATEKELCDLCGQQITPEHIQHERNRLDEVIADHKQKIISFEHEHAEQTQQLENLGNQAKALARKSRDAEKHQQQMQLRLQTVQSNIDRCKTRLQQVYRRLPPEYASLVTTKSPDEVDWLETIFPTEADIHQLEKTQSIYEQCEGQLGELDSLQKNLSASRQLIDDWQTSIDTLPYESWRVEAATFDQNYLVTCRSEHRTLVGAPAEYQKLQDQSTKLAQLDSEIKGLVDNIEAISDDAKRPSAEIARDYEALEEERKQTDELRSEAQGRLRQLQNNFDTRTTLDTDRKKTERLLRLYTRLAGLLSAKADGLQLYLLRHAEQSIVRFANEVLDRLSDGRLELKLKSSLSENGASSKAFDLVVCDKRMGEKDTGVEFTSGSQRFRIAVSLALAIGQYVGHESQRIESVIIDEGFGGLDKEGRDAMIDALDSLRQQLKRIVLVSHQEEFASAFSNKYLIQLEDGTSKVSLDV
jgi:DNA repair exonuclease SbcCD ATPase subunit